PAKEDRDGSDLVFTTRQGGPVRRSHFVHRPWDTALKTARIEPRPTPHDLRHTAVPLAIQIGAHPKAIQSRMGHASITTTFNVYGHLFPGVDEQLAADLDTAYRRLQVDTDATADPVLTQPDNPVTELDSGEN